jgi:hypothetical protein
MAMMARRYLAGVVLSLSVVLPVSADVCSDIAAVYDASRDRFSAWKGNSKRSDEILSTYRLPNAHACTIDLYDRGSGSDYSCEWQLDD